MGEKEVISTFYEGLTIDSKDELNLAVQGDFSQTPFTQAKIILEKLIEVKRSYEMTRGRVGRRGAIHAVEAHNDGKLEARSEQMERKLLEAVEKAKIPLTANAEEKRHEPPPPPQEHHYYYCEFPPEVDSPAQVNVVGQWNQNGNWIQGKQRDAPWRDHPNFRWSDQSQGPLTRPSTQQTQPFEGQPSWPTHIQDRPLNGRNDWSSNAQGNWPGGLYNNWSSGSQTNGLSRQQDRNWGHQYQGPHTGNQWRQPNTRMPDYALQYQKGNQQEPYSSLGHHQLGHGGDQSTQRYNRPQIEGPRDTMGPHPNALREMQETQKEQRAALEMLTKQLSQVAMSLGELRGNEGKIPATTQQATGRENVNAISVKSEDNRSPSEGSLTPTERVTKEKKMVKTEKESAEIEKKNLPSKKADPGVFTLPISIREIQEKQTMCDLGASINIMSYSMYEKLGDVQLVQTDLVIQLADGSIIHPEGILEEEIVRINKFTYPADFFVIKITAPMADGSPGILLGRPFLSTASTIIDVRNGTMNLSFHGEQLTFSINEIGREPQDSEDMQSVEIAQPQAWKDGKEEFLEEATFDPLTEEMNKKRR